MNGLVVWEGPSPFDGSPVVSILTGIDRPTRNPKTGWMLQNWNLPRGRDPWQAIWDRGDGGVCGDCDFRVRWVDVERETKRFLITETKRLRVCYAFRGVCEVWASYRAGRYDLWDGTPLASQQSFVRWGAYGEAVVVPREVRDRLSAHTKSTGYTRQWKQPRFQDERDVMMASVHWPEEIEEALDLGWRYFRPMVPGEKMRPWEAACPAPKVSCSHCGQCNGRKGTKDNRKSRVIEVHGPGRSHFELLATGRYKNLRLVEGGETC